MTVIRHLGSGGFGTVDLCRRDLDGQRYAKKTLIGNAPEAIERFAREVRLQESLDHPNVMKILRKHLKDPPYSYSMPAYARSLWDLIEDRSILRSEKRIHKVFGHVLDAVAYVHEQGVIHRDLKPMNVLMNDDSDVVLSDFGQGRHLDARSARLTSTGRRDIGTLLYSAPEQLRDGHRATERSDIFSLGRILFELWGGELVGTQDTADIPPAYAHIIARSTRQAPHDRFQSVDEIRKLWEDIGNIEDRQTEAGAITAALKLGGANPRDEAHDLLGPLLLNEDDGDLIHKSLMEIKPAVFAAMHREDAANTLRLLDKFVEFTANKSWGFNYTDDISDQCIALHEATRDFGIRAALIECVLGTGLGHDRFKVKKDFKTLVEGTKEPGEGTVIAERLAANVPHQIQAARALVSSNNLDEELQPLLGEQ